MHQNTIFSVAVSRFDIIKMVLFQTPFLIIILLMKNVLCGWKRISYEQQQPLVSITSEHALPPPTTTLK